MEVQGLAPNETMQLHEIITIRNLGLTKSITMPPLVSDEELKTMLKDYVKQSQEHIKELRGYLEQSINALSEAQ